MHAANARPPSSPPRPARAVRQLIVTTHALSAETAAATAVVEATVEAPSAEVSTAKPPPDDSASFLPAFLAWAAANGVSGIAGDAPTVGLFADGDSRGVLACADVAAGATLFSVPARLALAARAPSSTHADLAALLAAHVAAGQSSPWAPYIAALPRGPPSSAVGGGLPAEAAALLVCPSARALCTAAAAAPDADYDAAVPPLPVDRATFRWARTMAASRSVGFAGGGGDTTSSSDGLAARAMIPLFDMVNHAGLEAQLLLAGPAGPSANAEWVVVPDEEGEGVARIDVVATRAVASGEEITFSYGDRPNADLLAHWGFVPARNAADAVALFGSVDDALAWAREHVPLSDGDAWPPPPPPSTPIPAPDPLLLFPGGSVDARLAAALVGVGGDGYVRRVVAARAAALLAASPAPPLLTLLGELARADDDEKSYFVELQRRYSARAADVTAGGGNPASGGVPPPPPKGVPRAAWRNARLLALRASAYSLMILWDCLAAVGTGKKH